MDAKIKSKMEENLIDFQSKFLADILSKYLNRKVERPDIDRIKIVAYQDKQRSCMVLIDNLVIGEMVGSFETVDGCVKFNIEFTPFISVEEFQK